MAYQLTQTGSEIQDILDKVGDINAITPLASGEAVQVPNGTWTVLQSMPVEAGTYLFDYGVTWGANATGYRQFGANKSGTTAPSGRTLVTIAGTATQGPGARAAGLAEFSAAGTLYLWGRQNSGATLTAYPYMECVKLR